MAFKFFTVPIDDAADAEGELNAFLRQHRIVTIDRRWVERGGEPCWHFCVTYRDAATPPAAVRAEPAARGKSGTKPKVDYKEVLSPQDFAVFDRLRKKREQMAAEAGVPVYMVFNNEQLAEMVRQRPTSKAALEKIAGVGDGRVEKYGEAILKVLREALGENETQQQPA